MYATNDLVVVFDLCGNVKYVSLNVVRYGKEVLTTGVDEISTRDASKSHTPNSVSLHINL